MASPMMECWQRLPPTDQEEVLRHLRHAFLWRGWDATDNGIMGNGRHAWDAVQKIAAVFERHGMDFEEYT